MEENLEISEKERERRRKISEYRKRVIKEKREKGLKEYYKRCKKAKKQKEKLKQKEKEKEKKRKEREAEKKKHKRPVGRPKKPGPKKKYKKKKKLPPKKRGYAPFPPFAYKIISCKNGKQNKLMGKYRNVKDAYEKFNELKENNKNIIFPINSYGNNRLKNSIDEYILIEKNENKESSMLSNEYGVLVEHKTNAEGWIILDKFRYFKEEKFWVWGYDKKSDRKTFLWVFQNLLLDGFRDEYENKMICTYKNKVVMKSDYGHIDLIFCKTPEDAIRFYNLLEKYSKKNKLKRAIFIGDFSKMSDRRKRLEDELVEYTGLTKYKIRMKNNSFFLS